MLGDRVAPYTKTELDRRRRHPLTKRVHTVTELAVLTVEQGLTYRQVAHRWGMRTIAGERDLKQDLRWYWEQVGYPYGAPRSERARGAELAAWWNDRDRAITQWLRSLVAGASLHDCPFCQCRG